MEDNFGRFMYT